MKPIFKISILCVLPETLRSFVSEGLIGKAIQNGILEINLVPIREFADPPHFRVDDKPFGGGPGMILKCEPIVRALRSLPSTPGEKKKSILLSAKGKRFRQSTASAWAKLDHLVFICGRYEGVDERIADFYADEEISIGPYVLMGGEVAAATIIEAVARQIPGVIGNPDSLSTESFSKEVSTEFPQYTRPREFEGHPVPEILLRGNHREIGLWRRSSSELRETKGAKKKSRAQTK